MTRAGGPDSIYDLYEAWDHRLERRVAVKILRAPVASDPAVRSRFAWAAGFGVEHPNVEAVLDGGEHRGLPYLITEYLGGRLLEEELGEGPLPPNRLRKVLLDALAGLDAAHRAGAAHGDLKPGSIATAPDGTVKVVDFGLAPAPPPGPEPGAPGSPPGPSDDVRALGLLAARALGPGTGSEPLHTVIEQAVGSSPAGRFATARAMLDALTSLPAETDENEARPRPATASANPEPPGSGPQAAATPEPGPMTEPVPAVEPVATSEPVPDPEPVPPPVTPTEAVPDPVTTTEPVTATEPVPPPVTPTERVASADIGERDADPPPASSRRGQRATPRRRRWLPLAVIGTVVLVAGAVLVRVVGGGSDAKGGRSLTDVAARVLMPDALQLRTGLRLAQLNRNQSTVAEVAGTKELLIGSRAPVDDRRLLSEHPFRGGASSLWANFGPARQGSPSPPPTTDVAVTVLKFRSPADAVAVRTRWRWQETRRIETLQSRMQNPRYSRTSRAGLGSIDVVHFRDPEARRLGSQERGPADFVRYRGTRGQYLFEVVSRQRLQDDGTALPGSVDAEPSVNELLSALAAQFHSELRPGGAPATTVRTTPPRP